MMAEELAGFKHRFVAGSGQEGATLLLLHGTGGNENDLLPLGRELLPGANLLSPRGKVLEHGMPRFFRRLAEGVFDEEDLKFRTEELAGFVKEASGRYDFDPDKLFAVGFSNGANIAASLLLMRPNLLRGAVLLRPMVPFEPEALPDLSGVRIFVAAGEMDDGAQGEYRAPRRASQGLGRRDPSQVAADRARPNEERGRGGQAVALSGGV
jgi:phospholipase/carboxylesterase